MEADGELDSEEEDEDFDERAAAPAAAAEEAEEEAEDAEDDLLDEELPVRRPGWLGTRCWLGTRGCGTGQTNNGHCQCLAKALGSGHGDLPPATRARWPRW